MVRVAVYNVQGLRAGPALVAEALGSEEPDLVLIQECGSRRALGRFAAAMGMDVVSSNRLFSRIRNAVLSRPPWHLARAESRTFARQGGASSRGMITAHLRRTGIPTTAVSAHLGLSPQERKRHARDLVDDVASIDGPLLVGADLNEGPDGPAVRWIGERLFDAFLQAGEGPGETFPAADPTARIDYLFVNDRVRVLRARVLAGPAIVRASDHRPLLVDLEFDQP